MTQFGVVNSIMVSIEHGQDTVKVGTECC